MNIADEVLTGLYNLTESDVEKIFKLPKAGRYIINEKLTEFWKIMEGDLDTKELVKEWSKLFKGVKGMKQIENEKELVEVQIKEEAKVNQLRKARQDILIKCRAKDLCKEIERRM